MQTRPLPTSLRPQVRTALPGVRDDRTAVMFLAARVAVLAFLAVVSVAAAALGLVVVSAAPAGATTAPAVPLAAGADGPQAPFPIPLEAASADLATTEALMDDAITVVAAYWSYALGPFGLGGPVGVRWIRPEDEGTLYPCGTMSARFNAGYCTADDTIYVSDLFALGVWTTYSDVAVVSVLAHEYSHHLQAQAGLLDESNGPAVELHADCLAGWWLRAVSDAGGLGEGGPEAAATFFGAIGDDAVGEEGHHGTASERAGAFRHGFASQSCPFDNF